MKFIKKKEIIIKRKRAFNKNWTKNWNKNIKKMEIIDKNENY